MSTEFAERPQFFEGQYLGADDLQSLLTYFSELIGRHQLGSHSWGIAAGIDLVYQTSPQGSIELYLTPGIATDGYGRTVVVAAPFPIDAGLFAGQPAGLVNVWIRYSQAAGQGVRAGFEVCGAVDAYARVIESFLVEVGARNTVDTRESGVSVGDNAFVDAREAPGALLPLQPIAPDGSVPEQRFPTGDDPNLWLIPVGRVLWQGGTLVMPTPASAKQSRIFRHHSGWIGEALHGTGGLLRLGGRFIPRVAGSTVDQICDADLPTEGDLIFCTADPGTPAFREPIWLDADTRARGHLRYYGTRAEWVDATGTDYLAQGTVTAIRRTAPTTLKGADLEVLLGQPQGTAGPTRLTIGLATASGTDPCAIGFAYTPGVAIQQDGHVGIGSTDKLLGLPLTLRAVAANGGLLGIEDTAGTLAWQINLGPAKNGLNFTQADPTRSNLFIDSATGNVGIGTLTPSRTLHVVGLEIHSGGSVGGFSFQNRGTAAFVEIPNNGERWVWYASGGVARLWSNGDKLTVTPAGGVGIGTLAPAGALDVRGTVRLGNNGNYFAVGGLDEMRIVAGFVNAAGVTVGNGWTATPAGAGHYSIAFAAPFSATPVVVATLVDADDDDQTAIVRNLVKGGFTIAVKHLTPPNEGNYTDTAFSFIAYGPRA